MGRNFTMKNFFESYASVSMKSEPEPHANFYADEFITAGPSGSAVYKNDDEFLEWLKQVHDFNKKTGMESIQVMSVHDKPISEHYSLATVEWGAKYKKTGEELIRFEITYLLQLFENQPKIIAYISHEDQQTVMKERGII
jgi:hypothetical protein